MIIRKPAWLALCITPLLFILLLVFEVYDQEWMTLPKVLERASFDPRRTQSPPLQDPFIPVEASHDNDDDILPAPPTHHELSSLSTPSGAYFTILFGALEGINPNIIPHPSIPNTWIMVAQQQRSSINNTIWFAELSCIAAFTDASTLECMDPPTILPIAATSSTKCQGELDFFRFNIGPHDARVFYGPHTPYAIYGSQSAHTCFGQWIQDFRMLVDWGFNDILQYRLPTEMQRPDAYGAIEKNWFVFWDREGRMYAHYDIAPRRVFAALNGDGSVGPDLAPVAAGRDEACMARWMPQVLTEGSIHQATNSLAVTLCARADPECSVNEGNTFIFTIFQQKTGHGLHSVYEPYVMMFQQRAPFEIQAISKKPLWLRGRGSYQPPVRPLREGADVEIEDSRHVNEEVPDQTEMLYVTSMSWAAQGLKYHGFLDDKLFIAFGIEDERAAGIDILAGDLLANLGNCLAP